MDNSLIRDGSRKNCKNGPETCKSSIWSDKSPKNHEIDPEKSSICQNFGNSDTIDGTSNTYH